MKSLVFFLSVVLMSLAASAHDNFEFLEENPDLSSWGIEAAFSSQSYMEENNRITLLSPHLFEGFYQSNFRLALDLISRKLESSNTDRFGEIVLSIEENSKIYKDIAYSYLRLGVSQMLIDDQLYDGAVTSVPVAFGGHFVVANSTGGVVSYFVEYRFTLLSDYKNEKSLPGAVAQLPKETFFSEAIAMGIRYNF